MAAHNGRYDYTGQQFGRLTVTGKVGIRWQCQCSCGNTKTVTTTYLHSSKNPSCGCAVVEDFRRRRFSDLTGNRYGKLLATEFKGFNENRKAIWLCQCDCGQSWTGLGNSLTSGRTISCGCAAKDTSVYMPEKARRESAVKCAKRRARKLNACGSFTEQDIEELLIKQRGKCACCGSDISKRFSRDHRVALVNGGDNTKHNIELLCPRCNLRKGAKDEIAWANENGRLL